MDIVERADGAGGNVLTFLDEELVDEVEPLCESEEGLRLLRGMRGGFIEVICDGVGSQ